MELLQVPLLQTQVFLLVSWRVLLVVAELPGYILGRQGSYRFVNVLVRREHFEKRYCGWCRNNEHTCFVLGNIPSGALYTALPDRHSLLWLF